MSRYVAYSPNGQAYQCDTLAEVRRVEGKRKKRNGSCGCKKNPGKRRNGDCGCQKKPRRRLVRNPRQFYYLTDGSNIIPFGKFTSRESAVTAHRKQHAKHSELRNLRVVSKDEVSSTPGAWGPTLTLRNPSEDYSLGMFQGAMEHGKLPPPKTASADYRKGYAAGSKAGRSKPEARAQALGVFKASGSQRQGGETLQELVAGTSTVQNPRKSFQSKFVELLENLKHAEQAHLAAIREHGYFSPVTQAAGAAFSRAQNAFYMHEASQMQGDYQDATRSKRRNPQVSGQAVHDAYFRLAKVYLPGQSLPVYTGKVTLLDLARELRVSPEDISFNGTGLYNLNGRIYEMHSAKKRNPSLLTIGLVAGAAYAYTKSAGVRKHTKAAGKGLATGARAAYGAYKHHAKKGNPAPTSAAARKHLAHEKSEEATFATMLDKLPVGVTLKAGKHRIRKLSRGYVVVDGVRLTDKEAAKKIHRG